MIEKMKKVHLLMAESDSGDFLDELQTLGVVHIESGRIDGDEGITDLGAKISAFKKTLSELDLKSDRTTKNPEKPRPSGTQKALSAEKIQEQTREILSEIASLSAEADACRKNVDLQKPWGAFDSSLLSRLENERIHVSFHSLPQKIFSITDFGDKIIEVISRDRIAVHFVEVLRPDLAESPAVPMFPPLKVPMNEGQESRIVQIENQLRELESELSDLAEFRGVLAAKIARLEFVRERRMAGLSLQSEADGEIRCLSGYVPVSLLPPLNAFLEKKSIVPVVTDPESAMHTPIRLKNGPVSRLFEPVTKIFGLPQYVEIDTTPFVAPFFAFFFGLCLADVGYGALVATGALVLFFLLKNKTMKSLAGLGFILGLTTIIGGLFLNTVFGMQIDGLPELPEWIKSLLLFKDINDAMAFSIMLGVLQILVGFILQAVNRWRRLSLAGVGQPAGTFLLITGVVIRAVGSVEPLITIGPVPVGFMIASLGNTRIIGVGTAAAGILLILLFNNPGKKIWMRPLFGLWEMYGIASGIPGDILSYIRLFALSLSGGLLGGAINFIAGMIRGETPGILSWFFMLLVLVIGHSINFALSALGAFVHPLRLTFVEFYKSVGFMGGGTAYAPFGGKTK
jgi:V/A-type H+-transporting ATPase subunit I